MILLIQDGSDLEGEDDLLFLFFSQPLDDLRHVLGRRGGEGHGVARSSQGIRR